ncbi:MAG: glycosyltransferase family 2 protein [Saprospiraceae bacterium]|nr:glycosyltransferase family 2 protein [Saprospiraceae bacterium]
MNSNQSPFFSVIIPTYNRVTLLQNAVRSVLNQTIRDWQLVIVDDGSTDSTKNYLHSLKDPRITVCIQKKAERSTARNKGIEVSQGRYVCFLDDDDEYTEQYLEKFYNYYKTYGFEDLILRSGYVKNIKNKLVSAIQYNPAQHKNPVRFAAFYMCGVWTLCIPRHFLNEDNFHPDFPHWQDTHLILRLFAKHKMLQLPLNTYVYNIHPLMGSKKMAENIEEKLIQNIKPIEDLFSNYNNLVSPFLPSNTYKYLKAKKYLEFAHYDIVYGQSKWFYKYLISSLKYKVSSRFLKTYLVILRDYLKKLLNNK